MYTIVTATQKGGSGKTTLSGHLAVEAVRAGAGSVALIDTDPQGSLAHWWNARKAPEPHFARAGILDLGDALAKMKALGVQIAIVDTPPAVTHSISEIIAQADLVIVPTRPSPHDLRAVGATVDIAERHGKPVIFVINGANARARITGESAVALSQHGTVAPVTVHHRVDFAASMIDGRTAVEVDPKSPSAREISDLWVYLQDRLSRLMRDPTLLPEVRPQHFAINSLLDHPAKDQPEEPRQQPAEAGAFLADPEIDEIVPPPIVTPDYEGPDRRGNPDRRLAANDYRGPERRRVFGRRRGDFGVELLK